MQAPPEGAAFCEDYNAYDNEALCTQIAGSPWFMPCAWDSTEERCEFNSAGVFGAGSVAKCVEIDSRQTCESAGCEWLTDSYCEGNNSVAVGRCEKKFDNERNCNKACFACERQANGSVWSSSSSAEEACEQSEVGCDFEVDSNSPNGWRCMVKDVFRNGAAQDCNEDCGGCTFLPNAQSACDASRATCKWDSVANACVPKSGKICADSCGRCYNESSCVNLGRGSAGACTWNSGQATCLQSGGSQEVCWNGVDDDSDDSTDCADSGCFSDPACGSGFTGDCFAYTTNATCIEAVGCAWSQDNFGGWCDWEGATCWKHDGDQATCQTKNASCEWQSFGAGECDMDFNAGQECWGYTTNVTCDEDSNCTWAQNEWCDDHPEDTFCQGGGGFCEHIAFAGMQGCFEHDNDRSACEADSGCQWNTDPFSPDGGWCDPDMACFNDTNSNDQTRCDDTAGCRWIGGMCNPKGFRGQDQEGGQEGGHGGGLQCFIHNGNSSACANQTGCTYFTNPQGGFCDIGRTCNSPSYYNSSLCTDAGCMWNSQFNFCAAPKEVCFINQTLQMNQTACDDRNECQWANGHCEPTCFAQTNSSLCAADTGCAWMGGMCEDSRNVQNFGNMQGGPPVMLGFDTIGDSVGGIEYVDINGFGIKDMGDSYGFGTGVVSMVDSAMCNGERMTNGISGNGQQTHKYYVYLDTDGVRTGGCTLKNNASAVGYEFFFSYSVSYSGSVSETFSAQRCNTGAWTVSDITLTTFRTLVCQEIGGPMIAVTKGDLSKFSGLYDGAQDMKVYVAMATNTTNSTSPSDVAGPGWFTPGTADFDLDDSYGIGGGHQNEEFDRYGYTPYEDCYDSIDNDFDGTTDCGDYDCMYATVCDGVGVNSPTYQDTRTPGITGIKIENYPDAALIMYDTDKPANGSLEFYRNDSQCSALNGTVKDIGVTSDFVRNFKNWHDGALHEGSLGFSLTSNRVYYYKLKVCDDDGKCAVSKCSNFTTSNTSTCKYCNFVVRLKTPSTWYVSYDSDQDGNIDHVQGQVCGATAGMKMNYTNGRGVNVYMFDSLNMSNETGSGMIFLNTVVTKSALNDKVRDIEDEGSIIAGSESVDGVTEQYAGLPSETRDKIINNLHPERCLIQIPKPSDGCTELWHCTEDLDDCELTADANLTNETDAHCTWQVPFCEFSVWSSGDLEAASPGGGSPGGSGPGGGSSPGGAAPAATVSDIVSPGQAASVSLGTDERSKKVSAGAKVQFRWTPQGGQAESHSVTVKSVTTTQAVIEVASTPQTMTLSVGGERNVDLNADGTNDLVVKLLSVGGGTQYNPAPTYAEISMRLLAQATPAPEATATPAPTDSDGVTDGEATATPLEEGDADDKSGVLVPILIGAAAIVAIAMLVVNVMHKKKKAKEKEE